MVIIPVRNTYRTRAKVFNWFSAFSYAITYCRLEAKLANAAQMRCRA